MADISFDDFSQDYDLFVNWDARLHYEIQFIEARIRELKFTIGSTPTVLDAACGTGMHAIKLSQNRYKTAGADISNKMVEKARSNANKAALKVLFKKTGFMHLQEAFSGEKIFPFDVIICLGNSLPHLTSDAEIHKALQDFGACLKPGGLLILQNRNFDVVIAKRERWIAPQSHREGNKEWLFLRFYDFDPDGLITFNIIRLSREDNSPWKQKLASVRLFPLVKEKLQILLKESGFADLRFYGMMDEIAFDPAASENLVAVAHKT